MLYASRANRIVHHALTAAAGSSTAHAAHFNPRGPMPAAPAAPNRRPRPATSRYPISDSDFLAEKQNASQPGASASSPQDKAEATIAVDSAAVAAAPAAAAPAAVPPPPPTCPNVTSTCVGISAAGWAPPDCAIAAGPKNILVSVNSSIALYDMACGQDWAYTLDQWFSNVVTGHKIFDPRLLFDQYENRWVVLAAALGPDGTNISLFLLAVSATDDPNGAWYHYKLDATVDGTTPTSNWGDYPTLGVDKDALYIGTNMFAFNGGFAYAKLRIIPKTGPYSGGAVPFTDIPGLVDADGNQAFTVQPCVKFVAGPAGSDPADQFLVSSLYPGGNEVVLWRLSNPLSAAPTITGKTVPVSAYGMPPHAEQLGNANWIDTGDVRMQAAVYRWDPDAAAPCGAVWCALNTRHNWGETVNRAALQWFEIDVTTDPANPKLKMEGVYGASGSHYYYPAVMPTGPGGMIVGFSRSSSAEYASAVVAGRSAGDAAGTLNPSVVMHAGMANYTGIQRWGDYSGIALDVANASTAWPYAEFTDAGGNWSSGFASVSC